MKPVPDYDIAIVGGGLAGLSLSILAARSGYRVVLFEKEKYPFHKVCGEYISFESWDFLEELGVPLSELNLPAIRLLHVSAANGRMLKHMLPLGGFGISRFKLDALLADIARRTGVELKESSRADEISFQDDRFTILANNIPVTAQVVAGTFGKRSNLDIKWKRDFVLRKNNKLNNFVGVKYHVRTDIPTDTISLHNFKNGYCGISAIEDGKSCLCYLTSAANLNDAENSIRGMEQKFLFENPRLKELFSGVEFIFKTPVTISHISFEKKSLVEDHVLMIGDAAGMIAPLCGNGMSMALHASKIAFGEIDHFLKNNITRTQLEENYKLRWNHHFSSRLRTGRLIQHFFGSPVLSNLLISALKPFPWAVTRLISSTHGDPF